MNINIFSGKNILVIGDLMIDKYIIGDVKRISPEAPVQIVNKQREWSSLGGAGNVVNNLHSLGANVFISSVVDNKENGNNIFKKLRNIRVDTSGVFTNNDKISSLKTRILSSTGQQLIRIDHETVVNIDKKDEKNILMYVKNILSKIDAVILSDYNKGVLTHNVTQSIIYYANKKNIPIIVDPKDTNFSKYSGATIITPNKKEATQLTGNTIEYTGKHIRKLGIKNVLITLGKDGMILFERGKKPSIIPTKAKTVYDVSGAGDTVVSVLSLCKGCLGRSHTSSFQCLSSHLHHYNS